MVIDTTVVVDVLRGVVPAWTWMRTLDEQPLCCEVTRVEVLQGVRSHERAATEGLFGLLGWVPLDEEVARRAGALGRQYRRSHRGISVSDLVVAATTELLDAPLATSNVRHFPMFPDLEAPYDHVTSP